ncbi:MAG: glycosyltransferase family 9 protein [Bacteroidota bacterium]|nr:glycosyltransferase family 9 protein [Candidatus Kapabacteria bacterium]MCS7302127.1 glycosyltransferase family 9 protein [Candidatus Kapabacteria bacterium]MCX7936481.1 glycosyltransferase family 9 protein [Chlorobiota bacterium]MDW8074642.1 glycosyltransferase family 9 protein [Bacteroidota bacterium]MDW8270882.1 glycosyltransferase family 9 protein [Bacteroidota bacterium]
MPFFKVVRDILALLDRRRRALTLKLIGYILLWRNRLQEHDGTHLRRILVIRDDGLGDAITTLPMLGLLLRKLPAAQIDVLCTVRNAQLLAAINGIGNIWVIHRRPWDYFVLASRLRRQRYDVILLTVRGQTSWRALYMHMIAGSHTILVASHRGDGYLPYFDINSLLAATGKNEWERTFFLACDLLKYSPQEEDLTPFFPRVHFSWDRVCQWLAAHRINHNRYAVVNLSAYQKHNRWGYEQLAEVLSLLRTTIDMPIVVSGVAEDCRHYSPLLEQLGMKVYPPTDDIHEIAGLVAHSLFVLTPDTGIVHVATALRTPLVALYTANGRNEHEWAPFRHPAARVIHSEIGKPLSTIPPDVIVSAVHDLLAQLQVHLNTQDDYLSSSSNGGSSVVR